MASPAVNLMMSGKRREVSTKQTATVTTGKGGIKASLKVKAAGSKPSPGVDKTVNSL